MPEQMMKSPDAAPPTPADAGGGDKGGGDEILDAIRTLMVFAQAQKQQGNPAVMEALQAFVSAVQGGGAAPGGPGPGSSGPARGTPPGGPGGDMPMRGNMPMNANKNAVPVM